MGVLIQGATAMAVNSGHAATGEPIEKEGPGDVVSAWTGEPTEKGPGDAFSIAIGIWRALLILLASVMAHACAPSSKTRRSRWPAG